MPLANRKKMLASVAALCKTVSQDSPLWPQALGTKTHKAVSGLRVQWQPETHAWTAAMESRGRPQHQPYTFNSPQLFSPVTPGKEQASLSLRWF